MNKLEIFINDEVVYEYDRDITLEQEQLSFLIKWMKT